MEGHWTLKNDIDIADMCHFGNSLEYPINTPSIDQFRYIKIHTWLRGKNKRNVSFISEPDFFCFIPPSLAAK